ncbi:hypothetical protein Tdes44962_MAKER09899 [Teratosphaeria destructans]|uniref:Uncharacterized protein n=1 Tax=Teratosphaeria destructans TaxID=418781 RepID=A0A9W7SQX4_9PEZI|nr:hypothetical protein Tdes44962_MAKER09899 [Teratosphaeria destructans]
MRAREGEVLQHGLLGPLQPGRAGDRGRPGGDQALDPRGAGEGEVLVVGEGGEVGAGPAAEERRRAFEVGVLQEVLEFRLCLFVRFVDDDEDAGDEFDAVFGAAEVAE